MSSEEQESHKEEASLYFVLFSWLLALVIILSKLLHGLPKINSFISEAALVLLVGVVAGAGLHLYLDHYPDWNENSEEGEANGDEVYHVASNLLSFSPNVFFLALLPPIMFNSGYQLRRELFYRHFSPIVMLATLGTLISALCTGFSLYAVSLLGWFDKDAFDPTLLELLTFGSLIAATDTVSVLAVFQAKRVDPHLFYLCFGESSLNDAVALVLFKAFSGVLVESSIDGGIVGSMANKIALFLVDFLYEAVGSPALGIISGCITALIFKHVDFRNHPTLELPLYLVLLLYVPFIVAECAHLSGIVTIFFSGISARRYVSPNVSEESAKNAEVLFKLAAYLAETVIFLELGLSVWGLSGSFKLKFIFFAFIAALLGRAVSTYPLSCLYNWSLKEITVNETIVHVESGDESSVYSAFSEDDKSESSGPSSAESSPARPSLPLPAPRARRKKKRKRKTPLKRKDRKIPLNFMHLLWFAGLRGAVAYACVRDFPNVFGHNDAFIAATCCIVFFTIIVMGGATEPLLRYLSIEMNVDEDEYMIEWNRKRQLRGVFHRFEYYNIYKNVVREPVAEGEISSKRVLLAMESSNASGKETYAVGPNEGNQITIELDSAFGYKASDQQENSLGRAV